MNFSSGLWSKFPVINFKNKNASPHGIFYEDLLMKNISTAFLPFHSFKNRIVQLVLKKYALSTGVLLTGYNSPTS